jgi:hypothetical protein
LVSRIAGSSVSGIMYPPLPAVVDMARISASTTEGLAAQFLPKITLTKNVCRAGRIGLSA